MKFNEDYHYITEIANKMIEKGYADLDLHSIRINAFISEEQMANNRKAVDTLSREKWSLRCDEFDKVQNKKVEKILDILSQYFVMYGYKDKTIQYRNRKNLDYQDGYEWDLFCNFGEGRDARLSFNNHGKTLEQRYSDLAKIKEILKDYEDESITLDIQYTQSFHNDELKENAQKVYTNLKDKFINIGSMTGKIKPVPKYNDDYFGTECQYGFFKKGSKNKYYKITNMQIAELAK